MYQYATGVQEIVGLCIQDGATPLMIAAQGGKARTASSFKVDRRAYRCTRLSSVDLLHELPCMLGKVWQGRGELMKLGCSNDLCWSATDVLRFRRLGAVKNVAKPGKGNDDS